MALLTDLVSRVRLELGDQPQPFTTSATADGLTTVFELASSPISSTSPPAITTVLNGVVTSWTIGTGVTVDYQNGVVTFTNAPAIGTAVIVSGQAYRYFQDTDLDTFVNTAVTQHTLNRVDDEGLPVTITTLPVVEEYVVVILATIQALWALATDATFDIDIMTPDGVSIPRHQRYSQLLEMISSRQAQYTDLCEKLNVGLGRIEVFKLRRVSKLTGRLVPIYVEREFEDSRPQQRVFPPLNLYGGVPVPDIVPTHADFQAVALNTFSTSVPALGNLTGLTVHAHVRPYPNVLSSLAVFEVTITDMVNGVVTLALTPQQTWYLPPICFWDIQTMDTNGNVKTLESGRLTIERTGGF